MLTKLRLRNFKIWEDTLEVRLAPLTVLFGANSSGKSSLIQFLLMLRQTAGSADRRRVLHLGDRSTPVELGSFRDVVFRHDLKRELSFLLEWKLPQPLRVSDPVGPQTYEGQRISFECRIAFDPKDGAPHATYFRYELTGGDSPLRVSMTRAGANNASGAQFDLKAEPYRLVRNPGRESKLPAPVRFYGFPDEVAAYYQNAGFTSDLALSLEQMLGRTQYLGPLRTVPKRSHVWSGEEPEHVGWRGDRAVEALLAAAKRHISPGFRKSERPFQEIIAHWLEKMKLVESFSVRPIAQHRNEYEVVVRTPATRTDVVAPDVGFGVSQLLPVIVECYYAQPHTTLLLEQPEIHLHPSVQMSLADVFIEAVQSREGDQERCLQLIVESHSEHFLRRLQRRVAEAKVNPEDVALYFRTRGPAGARLEPLKVTKAGDIENWPEGFFGDELREVAARMDAAAKRSR